MDIERVARDLGREAAERIDADRVAGRVLARLREEGAREGVEPREAIRPLVRRGAFWWGGTPAWLKAAAVVALLLGATLFARQAFVGDSAGPAAVALPYQLAELEDTELEEMLDSLSLELPAYEMVSYSTVDLTEAELRQLLNQMES